MLFIDHTNSLLLKSKIFKFTNVVHFCTTKIMYKRIKNPLSNNILKSFSKSDGEYTQYIYIYIVYIY